MWQVKFAQCVSKRSLTDLPVDKESRFSQIWGEVLESMILETSHLIDVLIMTTLAGLATGIGGFVTFFMKRTDTRLLTYALGFSGGVMVYISFVEFLATAHADLIKIHGDKWGGLWTIAMFFGGMALALLIDRLVPEDENPHEFMTPQDFQMTQQHVGMPQHQVKRSGILFAIAIGIHNFPEGIATFAAGLNSLSLGASIALAVAMHNIPEGMIVAVPLYYGTGSRCKAILHSFLSGLAEPVGALMAFFIILPFISPTLIACLFACVAGIMVYISFDELLPMAEKWGHHHISVYGIISGMLLMALVLL
jgi:ZIP family zinc transporter